LTLFLVILSLFLVHFFGLKLIRKNSRQELLLTNQVLNRVLEARYQQLMVSSHHLRDDAKLVAGLKANQSVKIREAVTEHQRHLKTSHIIIADKKGRIIFDGTNPRDIDLSTKTALSPYIQKALAGETTFDIHIEDQHAFQVYYSPIYDPADPSHRTILGLTGLGFPLNDRAIQSIMDIGRMNISFLSEGRFAASTLPPNEIQTWKNDFSGMPSSAKFPYFISHKLSGNQTMELWNQTGTGSIHYVIHQSLSDSERILSQFQFILLALGLSCVALAGVFSLRLSKTLQQPIQDLIQGTRLVIDGRYTQRLTVHQNDEIGELTGYFNQMLQGLQQKEHIRSAMNKVVSREIAEELLKSQLKLGGEIRFCTILFSDIRNFTSISESLDPQEMIGMLNDYLTLMSQIIETKQGVIDKYIGDTIMALFGAPISHIDDVNNCLHGALEMLWALNDFNYRRSWEKKPTIRIGIGINTGPVVAGNMGSENRLNYTVLGDTVNLAFRLQSLTRLYKVNCIISEYTAKEAKGNFLFRELDLVRVKGRSAPVRIFELWDQEQNREALSEFFQKFQNARQFYILGDWNRAEILFKQACEMRPDDGPSQLFLERTRDYLKTPPPVDWDGVYTVPTK